MAIDPAAKAALLNLVGKGEGFAIDKIVEFMIPQTAAATPAVSARFQGDKYWDSNASKYYIAHTTGSASAADDWTIVN